MKVIPQGFSPSVLPDVVVHIICIMLIKFSILAFGSGITPHPNPLPHRDEGMKFNYNFTSISTPAGKSNLLNSSVVC